MSETSFTKTPQAKDDSFTYLEDTVRDSATLYNILTHTFTLDVMANDLGGSGKSLFSVEDGDGNHITADYTLLAKDVGANGTSPWELTFGGNWVRIANGKLEYRISDGSGVAGQGRDVNTLGDGEPFADHFVYAIRLGNGTLSQATVKIGITGKNDGPVVTNPATALAGAVTEAGSNDDGTAVGGSPTVSGQLSASDVDAGDTQTWSLEGAQDATYGTMVIDPATGKWTYTLNNSLDATQALKEDETVTVSYVARVTDGSGAFVDQDVTVTIKGTNDVPVITNVAADAAGAVTEAGHDDDGTAVGGSPTVSGQLAASDVDAGATEAWTLQGTPDATYGTMALNAATGEWTYTLNNGLAATQALKEGQVVRLTYVARVTDDFGAYVDQDVTVTIKGTNDVPVITSTAAAAAGSVTEAGSLDDGTIVRGTLSVTRTLTSSDPDAGATAAWTGSANGAFGTFAITAAGTWTYTLDNARADSLNEGQAVTETFIVTVTDQFGATATEIVTVQVNGANDAPVVQPVTGNAVEDGGPVQVQLIGDDKDAEDDGATLTYAIVGSPSAGTASVSGNVLTFNPGTDFQDLGAGETREVTILYTGTDTRGAVAGQSQQVGPLTNLAVFDYADITGRSLPPESVATGIGVAPLTAVGALGGSPFSNHLYLSGWGTMIDPTKYYETTFNPNGAAIDFEAVSFSMESTSAGNHSWTLRSSADNFASDVATGSWNTGAVTNFAASLGSLADATGPITFRWYITAPSSGVTAGFANHQPGGAGAGIEIPGLDLIFTGRIVTGAPGETVIITVTGVNDAPTIVPGSTIAARTVTELADGAPGENTANRSATGTIAFADVDTNDLHSATVAPQAAGYLGSLLLGAVNQGANSVGWTFDVADSALDFLAAGETRVQNYIIAVSDGKGGTANQNVAVTLTGTNDAPIITSSAHTGTIGEIADDAAGESVMTHIRTGTFTFTDVDTLDTHSATVTPGGSDYLGTLILSSVNQAANSFTGTFSVADAAIDYLAEGETLTQHYTISVSDGEGGTVSQTATVVITGTNDAPVASADSGATNEDAAISLNLVANDSDVDSTGLTVSSVSATSAKGAVISINSDGTVKYDPTASAALDAMGRGESTTDTFTYTVRDPQGGETVGTVTMTINGVNDAPASFKPADGWSYNAATGNYYKYVAASGVTWQAADAASRVNGAYLATITSAGEQGFIGGLMPVGGGILLGANDLQNQGTFRWVAGPETGTTLSYTNWAPTQPNNSAGEDYLFTFAGSAGWHDVANGNGAITGYVMERIGDGTISEERDGSIAENSAVHSAAGTIRFTDTDAGDVHTASVAPSAGGAGYVGTLTLGSVNASSGQLGWTFSVSDSALEGLAAGQVKTQSYVVTISDNKGGVTTQTVSIALVGSNDGPTVSGAVIGTAIEDGANSILNAVQNAVDPDQSALLSVVGMPASLPAGVRYNAATKSFTLDPSNAAYQALAAGTTQVVTVNYGISDGIVTTAASVSWTVTGTNDAPSLSGMPASLSFAEDLANATPQRLAPAAVVGDIDGNLANGSIIVTGLLTEDRVALQNQGTGPGLVGVNGSSVTYDGVVIGSIAGGIGSPLTISLNGSATTAGAQALVQHLTYANVSDTPTAQRSLSINIVDGAGAHLGQRFVQLTGTSNPFNAVDIGTYSAPTIMDVDGDGKADLVAGEAGGGLFYFRNNGNGTFTQQTGSANPFNAVNVGHVSSPTFVDLNGDGIKDLVVGAYDGTIHAYLNNGLGAYTKQTGAANPFNGIHIGNSAYPSFLDLDGDGDLDMLVGAQNGAIHAFRNNGVGAAFTAMTGAANPFSGVNVVWDARPALFDLDGDGDLDVVAGSQNGTMYPFRNNGPNMAFTAMPASANPLNGFVIGPVASIAFGDINGDGMLDAVTGTTAGTLSAFRNLGSGVQLPITVTPVNDAPVITSGPAAATGFLIEAGNLPDNSVVTGIGTATGTLTATDVDASAALTWSVVNSGNGLYGQLSITAGGVWTYTLLNGHDATKALRDGQTGTDSFTVRVSDGLGGTATQVVTLTVQGTNDRPFADSDFASVLEDDVVTGSVASNDRDDDTGAVLTYTLNAPVAGLTLNPDGSYSFDAGNAAYQSLAGSAVRTIQALYTVTDEFGASANSRLEINVTGRNDAPVASGDLAGKVQEAAPSGGFDDFEAGTAGWTMANGTAVPNEGPSASFSKVLGRFGISNGGTTGAELVSKTYQLDPTEANTLITFDFLKLDSWDAAVGDGSPPNEEVVVYLNGVAAFRFMPEGFGNPPGFDSASGSFTLPNGVSGTYRILSSGTDSLLGFNPNWNDRAYSVEINLAGGAASVTLGFGSTLDQPIDDESFAIDNVRVTHVVSDTGVIGFDDPDFGDVHSASVAAAGAGYIGTFSLGAVDQAGNKVGWSFNVANDVLATLAAGAVAEQSYVVTISDGKGGVSAKTVTVKIVEGSVIIGEGAQYTYVGSYQPNEGPAYSTNPLSYTAQEAAALKFGGNASDYAISTSSTTITHTGYYNGWAEHGANFVFVEDYKLDIGTAGYNNPGGGGTARSAWVQDGNYGTNHVWRIVSGSDHLTGTSNADTIIGSDIGEVIRGGGGGDRLTGGGGADIFVYDVFSHSTAANPDLILDFTKGVDKISLAAIDANPATLQQNDFTWAGNTATPGATQVGWFYDAGRNVTVVRSGDPDGAGPLEGLVIEMSGQIDLSSTDFIFM